MKTKAVDDLRIKKRAAAESAGTPVQPQQAVAEPASKPLEGADGGSLVAQRAKRLIGADDVRRRASTKKSVSLKVLELGQELLGQARRGGKKALAVALLGVSLLGATAAHAQDHASGPAGGALSPQLALLQQLTRAHAQSPVLQLTAEHAQWHNSSEITFTVPSHMRSVKDGQSVLVPLEGGRALHMIELRYQDTRALRDLELNRRAPGGGAWETFRGDEYRASVEQEKAGALEIKREPDHNSAWINNPIRVRVEVVDADGHVLHHVGKKFVDFHIHDAWSPDGPGSPETDNISNSYESLPQGALPAGAQLRLTPVHENRRPWEADRVVAMDLSWVKPIYTPEGSESVMVRTGDWAKPDPEGYAVEAGRPISAVYVKWTDHGGTSSGSVRVQTADGTFRSASYNVGSGETEMIPLDGVVSKDGKLFIEGWGLEVGDIKVLYK